MVYIRHLADVDTVDQSFKVAVGYDMMWPSTPAGKLDACIGVSCI